MAIKSGSGTRRTDALRAGVAAMVLVCALGFGSTESTAQGITVGSLQITSGPPVRNQPVTLVGFHPDCAPAYNWDWDYGEEGQMIAASTNGSNAGEVSITWAPEYAGLWTVTARCRNYSELVARFVVTETAPPPTDPPAAAAPTPAPTAPAPTTDVPAPTTVSEPPPAVPDGVMPRYVA